MQQEPGSPVAGGGRRPEARTRRLTGLGARMAEIAHELKVPLSLVVGSLEHLETSVRAVVERVREPETPDRDALVAEALGRAEALLRLCQQGATRLERVVEQVSDYTRGQEPARADGRVELPRALRLAADLVARTALRAPSIVLDVPDLPPVRGDEAALGRVFINVLRNAVDALVDVPDPVVEVVATAQDGLDALARHVEVRVRDNGPGITLRDRHRIFEPFVTGKSAGGGLGLGLAIAREIVEASGGTIELAPGSSPGTEFVIRLPVAP